MPSLIFSGEKDPPKYFITEPLRSFTPEKLPDGNIRIAIAKAGQHAYNTWGEEATLTEDFLSRDFKTWEGGLVSINHEDNHGWVKAKMYNLEYDRETKLVICSFSGIPDWLSSLIYSDDYRGTSQECIPIEMKNNSMDVVKGYGTGVTIVTDPYEPAATQEMGVGVRPALSAILASKYPTQKPLEEDQNMTEKTGGGTPAISVEAFESTVSENVQIKSQVKTLELDIKQKGDEIVSWKQKYTELESGEAQRTEIAVKSALESFKANLKAEGERETSVTDLKSIMDEDSAKEYLSTNPTIEQIKSITKVLKVNFSKGVGSSTSGTPSNEKSYNELNSAWNSKLGRA